MTTKKRKPKKGNFICSACGNIWIYYFDAMRCCDAKAVEIKK